MSAPSAANNAEGQGTSADGSIPTRLGPTARPRFDQTAPNYSQSQAGTSTTDSHWRGKYYIDHYRNTAGLVNKEGPLDPQHDDSSSQTMATEIDSLVSYSSMRDIGTFVKEIGGRMFNNQSDLYMLPSDDEEFQRLTKQHYTFVLSLGGLYPCPELVEDILRPRDDPSDHPSILDLGCGSGIWAIEMAHRFPHARVVGIDLAPIPIDLETAPTNLRFEIDDINLGLEHYHGSCDLVHIRCIGSGIRNYATMMRDAEACLKPGGLIIFMDGDMTMYSEDFIHPVPIGLEEEEGGDPKRGSWHHRLCRETRWAGLLNGGDIDGLEDEIDRGIWDHPLIDPDTVKVASAFVPIGPWASASEPQESQRLQYAGSLMRQDMIRIGRAWHALLAKAGIPRETLEQWSARAEEEINCLKFHMSLRWRMTWGRRRSEEQQPQESSILPAESQMEPSSSAAEQEKMEPNPPYRPYPKLVIYTKEEALRAIEMRKAAERDFPVPLVMKLKEKK